MREKSAFFSRDPPGRRRARVAPAVKVQTLALADSLRVRARHALFSRAPNRFTRTVRVARDASRENRAPTREKEGRYIASGRFRISSLARRAARIFLSSLLFFPFGPVAVPRGVALQISPPSLVSIICENGA